MITDDRLNQIFLHAQSEITLGLKSIQQSITDPAELANICAELIQAREQLAELQAERNPA